MGKLYKHVNTKGNISDQQKIMGKLVVLYAIFLNYFFRDNFSAITVRKKPCTIAVGTPRTVLSNVSRNTGTRSTNASVDGNGSHGNQRTPSSFRQRETTGFKKTRVSDCDETISLNLMIKTCEVERRSVSHVEFCCSRLIMRRVLQFSQYIFFVAIRFIDLKKMSDCRYLVC